MSLRSVFALLIAVSSCVPAVAQRDLKVIPPPDPELERATFVVPEGFEVNLFAADPQIAKPIQMNFDPQGRLWIASSETYPHIEPGAKANDKILYLHDVDGDGVSDQTQIFADGLLIPTAIAPGNGGVYVGASTELLFFKDTDGDGRADSKEIVLSGFGTEDTHHIIHTMRYGPESRLYFSQSIYIHSHIETPWGIRRLNAGGIWRFRPETLELSVFARGLVNTWGTDFDRYGQTFATDGAGGEGINYMVPGAYYVTSYGAERILHGLNPGSPKHCGLEIVESEHLPDDWQGSLITNDFRGHRVCRFVLSEDGSGYRSQEQQEVIKSDHVAFRPVDVKQGPDGAIYIADWYNPIIQHGEVDFRDPRRDHTHGRIWRVSYKGKKPLTPVNFTKLETPRLLEHVASANRFSRSQAKVVLKERGDEMLPQVNDWVSAHADNDKIALEALWIHQSVGKLNSALLGRCLESNDHRIRAAATRVVGQMIEQIDSPLALLTARVVDDHPQVRLEAIRALAESKQPEAVQIALQSLQFDVDENIDYALWLTCRDLEPYWTPAVVNGELSIDSPPAALPFLLRATKSSAGTAKLLQRLKADELLGAARNDALAVIADIGSAEQLGQIFDLAIASTSPEVRHACLVYLSAAAANRNVVPPRELLQVKAFLEDENASIREAALRCVGAWKFAPLRDVMIAITEGDAASLTEKIVAVQSLGAFADQPSADALAKIANGEFASPLQRIAIEELLKFRPNVAISQTVKFLKSEAATETQIAPLLRTIAQRKGASDLLAKALENETLPKDSAVVGARVLASLGQQDSALAKIMQSAGQLNQDPVKLSPEQMAEMVAELQTAGDPARGQEVFRRDALNCLKCHAIGPAGGDVGSNILSLGATAQPDYIIESILDPNAKVKEGFHTVVVATDEGQILSGIQARETDSTLFLKDAEGKEIAIAKSSIEQQKQGVSLMPAGLTSNITHQELVDLAAFLYALGRLPEYTISTQPVVRLWEAIQATDAAAYQFRRISYAAAATDNPEFQWKRVYSEVNGDLALNDLPELSIRNRVAAGNRGMSFVRAKFESNGGEVRFRFNDPAGLQIWVDDKPVDAVSEIAVNVSKGSHQITIAIDRAVRSSPLRVTPVTTDTVELATGK